ncbi:SEC-C metal-binding domain-containing protein [Roseburia hominis]
MENERLKSTIVEVVENQLGMEECTFVKEAYEELLDRGYSERQAKEKIGAVLLENMYDMLNGKREYDEKEYRRQLEAMLDEDFLNGDKWDRELYADEEDIWKGVRKGLDEGQRFYDRHEMEKCLTAWLPVWERVKRNVANAYKKPELFEVDEATDFEYEFEEWLQDMTTAYFVAGKFEELITFCKEVKETFAWKETAPNAFNAEIGKALLAQKKLEESDRWFEEWLAREPDNFECAYESALHWMAREQKDRAREVIVNVLEGVECDYNTQDWFMRAGILLESLGDEEKGKDYKKKSDEFFRKMLEDPLTYGPEDTWEDEDSYPFGDYFDGGFMDYMEEHEKQKPIVKDKKIYPNDPCPCGSGKKYKKCCGRK